VSRTFFHFVAAVSMAAASMVSAVQAGVVSLGSFSGEFVTVGDPGNLADSSGYGAVSATFDIMKFEFTNQQYVQFLNTVDPTGANSKSLYQDNMGSTVRGGINRTLANDVGSRYEVKTNMGNKPVNYVSWFDAARVSNWLHNGATSSSDTETGAYTLSNAIIDGDIVARNPGALFFIPTENEWYKAAYYKRGSTNAGYWTYATKSDGAPTAVTANPTGDGSAGTGSTDNSANYNSAALWLPPAGTTAHFTSVGTNGGPSAYDTFDMSGNAHEWVSPLSVITAGNSVIRGGGRGSAIVDSTVRSEASTSNDGALSSTGFRLASLSSSSPPAVPEPSMMVIGTLFGIGGLMAKRRMKK